MTDETLAEHKDKPEDIQVLFTPAEVEIEPDETLAKMLVKCVADRPQHVTIERKSSLGNHWVPVTYRQFEDHVRALAKGFIHAGLQPGDAVGMMSRTRYEWTLIDYAVMYAGGYVVPIYETSSRDQAEWILSDAGVRFAVVETGALKELAEPLVDKIDTLEKIFVIDDGELDTLIDRAVDVPDSEVDERIAAGHADQLATIIYTSGTTGRPKGVELTQRNLLHVVKNGPLNAELKSIIAGQGKRTLLFLPMAHVFARFVSHVAVFAGATLGHAPDTTNLVADLGSFKPTFVLAVPRVFEKVYNAADAKASASKIRGRIFRKFAAVAIAYARAEQDGNISPALKAQHAIGNKLVYGTLREIMGGNLEWAISGGGPLGERLGMFYRGVGLTILEGYGLTETSAPTTVNRPGYMRIGSIGPAYPGCTVSVDKDGEILVKGPHVTIGYHNNEEATREAFTDDGWFRTGDIGRIDDDGFLWITGRKKEIIVTAGGKNVAPAVLEDRLRGHPLVSQVVVVGDNRPFIGALVTLDADMLPAWLRNHGLDTMTVEEAGQNPQVLAALDRAVSRANEAVSRAESIRKFRVLAGDFTVENNYLTPSLKVKRHEVLKDFAGEVDKLYEKN